MTIVVAKVFRIGYAGKESLGVVLHKPIAKLAGIGLGDYVRVSSEEGSGVVRIESLKIKKEDEPHGKKK